MRLVRTGIVVLGVAAFVTATWGQGSKPPRHLVQDWSSRHVVFTGLTRDSAAAWSQIDSRAWHSWAAHAAKPVSGPAPQTGASVPIPAVLHRHKRKGLTADWNEPLFGGVDPRFSPAKFSFDVNAAPDCTNDYVVFPTTNTGPPGLAAGSASLIAFNNLYTGPGPSGICPTPLAPSDQPSMLFAYNTATVPNGTAPLSPALSLDGTKIAFVETNNVSNDYTAFHVLTWKAGEGTAVGSPAVPGDCSAGNSCMTTLVLSNTHHDSFSSPFIDYAHDVAYVADDGGFLHKITPVFRGTPAEVTTGGWPLSVTVFVTRFGSPVFDSVSGHIFMTDDSSLWVIDVATARVIFNQGGYITVADPIVDSTDGAVFLVGCSTSGDLVVDQTDISGTRLQRIDVGTIGPEANVYTGTFDNKYFNDPTTGSLYVAGSLNAGAGLFQVGFTAGFNGITMDPAKVSGPLVLTAGSGASMPGPLTEVFNPNLGATPDRLFVGIDENCATGSTNGCIESLDISSGLPVTILDSYTVAGSSILSVGGIIVDNVSTSAQAANIYVEASPPSKPLSAIKLTQAALQ